MAHDPRSPADRQRYERALTRARCSAFWKALDDSRAGTAQREPDVARVRRLCRAHARRSLS